jgi:hypothetical protein
MADTPTEGTPAPDTSAADEATYKAGLRAIAEGRDPDAPAEEPEKKPAAEEPKADADGNEDAPESEVAEDEKPEADADEETDEPKVDKAALAQLAKEKRSLERLKVDVLDKERQVVEREQKVARGEAQLTAAFREFTANPVEMALKHNLIPEADFKFYAQQFLLLSPEGLKDPRSKPEAERLRRERERDTENRRALAEVEKLRKEREEEKAAAAGEKQLNEYIARIDTSVPAYKAKTPLLAKAMEKDAGATRRELFQVAYELAQANAGEFVEPGRVLLAWEKQQRERIARLGLTAPTAAPAAPTAKAKTPNAAKSQGQKPPAAQAADDPDIATSDEEYQAGLRARLKRAP